MLRERRERENVCVKVEGGGEWAYFCFHRFTLLVSIPSSLLSFPVLFLQPLFSQERAPTSVAYAENQSMFLDSLVGDAAWRARYCKDRSGNRLPWALHEEDVRATHPYVNVNE